MCLRQAFGIYIGYLTIIIYSIGVITFCCCLANRSYIDRLAREESENDPSLDVTKFKSYLRTTFACFLSVCCMMVAISGLLIRAIYKRRHKYMVPWLLLMVISIGCNFIYNVVVLFKVKYPILRFFCGILGMAAQCMILFPIYTLYKEMREENHRLQRAGRTNDYPHLIRVP